MKPKADVRRRAMDLLARREHSAFELRRKLVTRGFEAEEVDPVVAVLQEEGLVSDARFAEVYARMRAKNGHGPRNIELSLQERGVSADLIEGAMDFPESHWIEQARQVREKKFGPEMPEDFTSRAKQMRFLQYRGFTSSHINAVID